MRCEETFSEVWQTIATFESQWGHRSGHYDGDLQFGQRAFQVLSTLDHRIRPVRNDDGDVLFEDRANHPEQQQTIFLLHLQTVDVHKRHDVDFGVRQALSRRERSILLETFKTMPVCSE